MEIHTFTEEELAIAKQIVFAEYIGESTLNEVANPMGVLLGGQPAAGKTGLIRYLRRKYRDLKFIVINGDEYRQYHPRAKEINNQHGQDAPKYTQPFSNALVEYLKAECLRLQRNFIIEGTMRSYAVIERTAFEMKQAGFRCEAHALAVSRQDSLLGVFERFEGDKQRTGVGRFSPIDVHDEAYRQIPINLGKAYSEKIFDHIAVYTRQSDGQLQLSFNHSANNAEQVDFIAEFERLRQPVYTKSYYYEQWVALNELARQRGETNEVYLKQIDDFVKGYSQ